MFKKKNKKDIVKDEHKPKPKIKAKKKYKVKNDIEKVDLNQI